MSDPENVINLDEKLKELREKEKQALELDPNFMPLDDEVKSLMAPLVDMARQLSHKIKEVEATISLIARMASAANGEKRGAEWGFRIARGEGGIVMGIIWDDVPGK